MIKVGITGQSGFIGTHLFNTLGLNPGLFERITFSDGFFDDQKKLNQFVKECDVIVHLAAMNRHHDPELIYKTNLLLVSQLINACESTGSKPYIFFSSSTQEERDNLYGRSKKEGRELFEKWAKRNSSGFSGLIIPNVFGPFGQPNYNSVISTFCHQLTHGIDPILEVDNEITLIYVNELVKIIIDKIKSGGNAIETISVPGSIRIKVSELLAQIRIFKSLYLEKGIIPDIGDPFRCNLFNTFLSHIDHRSFFPFGLKLNSDNRGTFSEIIKTRNGGQVSFSTTLPGAVRGNHFHTRKSERFTVIKGSAIVEIRRIGSPEKLVFKLDGNSPSFVDMPVWFTHNISNTGKDELITIFWISEHYDPEDPDTFFEPV
jgi:UDP-2-acetamido-2,6-beta-L-arabino-hexul-4-ose reductase